MRPFSLFTIDIREVPRNKYYGEYLQIKVIEVGSVHRIYMKKPNHWTWRRVINSNREFYSRLEAFEAAHSAYEYLTGRVSTLLDHITRLRKPVNSLASSAKDLRDESHRKLPGEVSHDHALMNIHMHNTAMSYSDTSKSRSSDSYCSSSYDSSSSSSSSSSDSSSSSSSSSCD